MSRMVALFEIADYKAWKARFDSDPVGRDASAIGYTISRNTDNAAEVLLEIEFGSIDDARALLERLADAPSPPESSDMRVKVPPTIFEVLEGSTA